MWCAVAEESALKAVPSYRRSPSAPLENQRLFSTQEEYKPTKESEPSSEEEYCVLSPQASSPLQSSLNIQGGMCMPPERALNILDFIYEVMFRFRLESLKKLGVPIGVPSST